MSLALAPSARKVLKRLGLRRPASWQRPWSQVIDPHPPDPLGSFRFFAIIGTWMEADVIGATVKNAFLHGCDRVYLVDNDSPDDTVAAAEAAGAVLARSYTTDSYDENLRLRVMNETVDEVSRSTGEDHVWWMFLDADEFLHPAGGGTLRELLSRLDRRCRVVGSRLINHYPSGKPEYLPGFHPIDFQPLCQPRADVEFCTLGHFNHPFQRWDRTGPRIICSSGFHKATASKLPLAEANTTIYMHHFQLRDEDLTRRRLEALCQAGAVGTVRNALNDEKFGGSSISKRFRSLDAAYRQDWAAVENSERTGSPLGVDPVPWRDAFPADDVDVPVWYGRAEFDAAVDAWRAGPAPTRAADG